MRAQVGHVEKPTHEIARSDIRLGNMRGIPASIERCSRKDKLYSVPHRGQ